MQIYLGLYAYVEIESNIFQKLKQNYFKTETVIETNIISKLKLQ